jgi:hypothetical protein
VIGAVSRQAHDKVNVERQIEYIPIPLLVLVQIIKSSSRQTCVTFSLVLFATRDFE